MVPALYEGVLELPKTAGKGRFWHIHISSKVLNNQSHDLEILLCKTAWIPSNTRLDHVPPSAIRLFLGVLEGKRPGTGPQYHTAFLLNHFSEVGNNSRNPAP